MPILHRFNGSCWHHFNISSQKGAKTNILHNNSLCASRSSCLFSLEMVQIQKLFIWASLIGALTPSSLAAWLNNTTNGLHCSTIMSVCILCFGSQHAFWQSYWIFGYYLNCIVHFIIWIHTSVCRRKHGYRKSTYRLLNKLVLWSSFRTSYQYSFYTRHLEHFYWLIAFLLAIVSIITKNWENEFRRLFDKGNFSIDLQ